MNEEARRSAKPKRVRLTTDRKFASGCSPPRLAANAVTFSFGAVADPDTDFHRAATRHRGRTHPGLEPGSMARWHSYQSS